MVWLNYILKAVTLAPAVVKSVETVVTGAKQGATKKDLAMASLGISKAVAEQFAPEHQEQINAASQIVSIAIDQSVAFANLVKQLKGDSTSGK